MPVLQNLFTNRATVPLLVVVTLISALLFRALMFVLVMQVARSDRKRKTLRYRVPVTHLQGRDRRGRDLKLKHQ